MKTEICMKMLRRLTRTVRCNESECSILVIESPLKKVKVWRFPAVISVILNTVFSSVTKVLLNSGPALYNFRFASYNENALENRFSCRRVTLAEICKRRSDQA